nr:hypothetical protein [Tanacetum cinerariifolium]
MFSMSPCLEDISIILFILRIEPDLISWIKEAQKEDSEIWTIVENLDKQVEFRLDDDNVLWQDTRLVVPNDVSLREALLTEAHSSLFSVKIEHQRASGLLQQLDIPVWKWDEISIDKHRKSLEFQPGDHVFLKVSPAVESDVSASRASLVLVSSDLSRFLIELVRGYKYHPLHFISYPLDQIRTDLSYVEEPEAILDRQDRVMRKKTIPFVKILWRNHPER